MFQVSSGNVVIHVGRENGITIFPNVSIRMNPTNVTTKLFIAEEV